jgi:hypothetical protein
MPAPINKTSHKSDKSDKSVKADKIVSLEDDYKLLTEYEINEIINDIINNPNKYKKLLDLLSFEDYMTFLNNKGIKYYSVKIYENKLEISKVNNVIYSDKGKIIGYGEYIYYKQKELPEFFRNVISIIPLFTKLIERINRDQRGGKKQGYKSTKTKVSVIINKKTFVRTVYTNAKNVSYIRVNNQYKLLSKYVK